MLARTSLLALALLGACDEGPRYGEATEAPEGASRAAETARDIWADRLGAALPEPPAIQWYTGKCLDLGVDRCVIGRTEAAGANVTISGVTSVPARVTAHELLHWALYLADGSVDGGHTSPLWDEVVQVTIAVNEEF